MDKKSLTRVLETITPLLDTIVQPEIRSAVEALLNLVEVLAHENEQQKKTIQALRDDINRLKGEQGQPRIRPQKPTDADNHSSEADRKKREKKKKARKRSKKNDVVTADRQVHLTLDLSTLPADAQYKGRKTTVIQDLKITTDNIEFLRDVYYSPSLNKTFMVDLPKGYDGEFGPNVKSSVITLYHEANMTQPALKRFLNAAGLVISKTSISRMLTDNKEVFHQEKGDILDAGLKATYQQTDDTSGRVNGENYHVHILCNPFFTAYFTRRKKDRLTLLEILCRDELKFTINEETLVLLEKMGLPEKQIKKAADFQQQEALTRSEIDSLLLQLFPNPKKQKTNRRRILEASALIYYYHLPHSLKHLMCDDAPQFNLIAKYKSLCWIHEGRHYKKLSPFVPSHQKILENFRENFWDYYQSLLDYTNHPSSDVATQLNAEFDRLFSAKTGYDELDKRIALTAEKKEALLMPLKFPFLPLHNNDAENGAQHQARSRDIHLQTKNEKGTQAKDTFATLVKTARKLDVNLFDYFHDRITETFSMPSLASLILEKCGVQPNTS